MRIPDKFPDDYLSELVKRAQDGDYQTAVSLLEIARIRVEEGKPLEWPITQYLLDAVDAGREESKIRQVLGLSTGKGGRKPGPVEAGKRLEVRRRVDALLKNDEAGNVDDALHTIAGEGLGGYDTVRDLYYGRKHKRATK
jgi:hypothetical protein